MSPGRIDRLPWACPECHGTDVGGVGFVHHAPGCSRREFDKDLARICRICSLTIQSGEDRAYGPPPRHLDCAVDLEAQLDEDHDRIPSVEKLPPELHVSRSMKVIRFEDEDHD